MDSIDWSDIHHFETALYRSLLKGIKQKKRHIPLTMTWLWEVPGEIIRDHYSRFKK